MSSRSCMGSMPATAGFYFLLFIMHKLMIVLHVHTRVHPIANLDSC